MAFRAIGLQHPNELLMPQPPDSVQTLLIASSSGQAMDWMSTGSTAAANADAAGITIVRFTGMSTAGALLNFLVNLFSTACAAPSSGSSNSSTGTNHPVLGSGLFQVPSGSTGFSVAALSSGYVMMEGWRRG